MDDRHGHDAASMRALALLTLVLPLAAGPVTPPSSDWASYGRDPGGSRSFAADADRPGQRGPARSGLDVPHRRSRITPRRGRPPALETTPLVVEGTMYLSTPLGRAIALDPATGRERWRYDPGVDSERGYGDFASRGLSYWRDGRAARRRVRAPPVPGHDRRAAGGARRGQRPSLRRLRREGDPRPSPRPPDRALRVPGLRDDVAAGGGGDIVIAGSAIADNSRLAPASGEVRGFDARTGALRWTFDPIPQDARDPAYATWRDGSPARTGPRTCGR